MRAPPRLYMRCVVVGRYVAVACCLLMLFPPYFDDGACCDRIGSDRTGPDRTWNKNNRKSYCRYCRPSSSPTGRPLRRYGSLLVVLFVAVVRCLSNDNSCLVCFMYDIQFLSFFFFCDIDEEMKEKATPHTYR